jgi:hypothetical protein
MLQWAGRRLVVRNCHQIRRILLSSTQSTLAIRPVYSFNIKTIVAANLTVLCVGEWTSHLGPCYLMLNNFCLHRYKQQILYGCENPDCRTPTCLSFQKRATDGPFRQYTDLSARTLACYLASQDNAERGLCRNPPKQSSEFPPTHAPHFHKNPRNSTVEASQVSGHSDRDTHPESHQPLVFTSGSSRTRSDFTEKHDQDSVFSTSLKTKDPKSFTQNLFDTLSLRMVEWLPLRQTTTETHHCASPTLHGRRKPHLSAAGVE